MLIDYEYNKSNENLILSYIDKIGNIKLKHYPWKSPTKYIITSDDDPDKDPNYVTWDGSHVKQIYTKYPNKYSIYYFLDSLPKEDQEMIFGYQEPNIFFVDIENEILDKKPQPELAESKILSISIVNKNKVLVLGIDPLNSSEEKAIENDINNKYGKQFNRNWKFKYVYYRNEYEMLLNFFKAYVPKMSVITGWNFKKYDWVFLVNRARKIGVDPTYASFTRKLTESWMNNDFYEDPAHRLIVDYMELYDKWDTSIKVKESSSLDFVSEKILGVKKVNYEGNLKVLYESDFKKFIYYNAVDSILVQLIHEKQQYINILYATAILSRIKVNSAFSTLAVTEGFLRGNLKNKKNIVLVRNDNEDSEYVSKADSVKGGFVLEPVKGMSVWTTCYDFKSLYPFTIIEFNISADSYKGQKVKNKDYSLFNGHQLEIASNDIVLKNGSVFRNETGIVNQSMQDIYKDRKHYKKEMMKNHEELEELKALKKRIEQII